MAYSSAEKMKYEQAQADVQYYGTCQAARPMTELELLEDRRRKTIIDLHELETIIQAVKAGSINEDTLVRIKNLYK